MAKQVALSPRAVFRFLLWISVLLVVASSAVLLFRFGVGSERLSDFVVPFFHLGVEQNLPTFFSVLLLASAALVSFVASRVVEADRFLWRLLAAVFLFLSLDEFAELHERLIVPVRNALGTSGFFHFAWIIPYFLLVLVLAAVSLRWLLRLPSRTRRLLVLSAAVYITGALVMEGVSGLYLESVGGGRDGFYNFLTMIEETGEMLGVTFYIYAVSSYMARDLGGVSITIDETEAR